MARPLSWCKVMVYADKSCNFRGCFMRYKNNIRLFSKNMAPLFMQTQYSA